VFGRHSGSPVELLRLTQEVDLVSQRRRKGEPPEEIESSVGGRSSSGDGVLHVFQLAEHRDRRCFELRRVHRGQLLQHCRVFRLLLRQLVAGRADRGSPDAKPVDEAALVPLPGDWPTAQQRREVGGAHPVVDPRHVDLILIEHRQVGSIVADRVTSVLEPRELQPVEDTQSAESNRPGGRLGEMQDRRDERAIVVDHLIVGGAQGTIADVVVDALRPSLGVAPVHDSPVWKVNEVLPRIRCRSTRSLVRDEDDRRMRWHLQMMERDRADPTHVPNPATVEVDPREELVVFARRGAPISIVVAKAVRTVVGQLADLNRS
jgi:hypothetical protein